MAESGHSSSIECPAPPCVTPPHFPPCLTTAGAALVHPQQRHQPGRQDGPCSTAQQAAAAAVAAATAAAAAEVDSAVKRIVTQDACTCAGRALVYCCFPRAIPMRTKSLGRCP